MKNLLNLFKVKELLKKLFSNKKNTILVILAVIVILALFLMPNLFNAKEKVEKQEQKEVSVLDYTKSIEDKLESMLINVAEINKVDAMVMVESTPKIEYLTETEEIETPGQNGSSSTKSTTVVFEKDGSVSTPIVVTTIMPKVTGVFIVVNNISASTKISIINSISVVLNIKPECISILQES